MSGWFSVKHGIRKHPIFKGRPDRLGAWIAMLDEAAYADTEQDVAGTVVKVRRGELCASQAMLEEITGLSRQQLRTFLSALEKEGTISTRPATNSTKSRTIVTFCSYNKYQSIQPSANQRPTKRQPTKEQDNNTPPLEGASAPEDFSDPAKVIFTSGVKMLKASGKSDQAARAVLGKWRRDHGDYALIAALGRAQREGAIDPISFIEGCFRFAAKKADPKPGDKRISRDGLEQEYGGYGVGWLTCQN